MKKLKVTAIILLMVLGMVNESKSDDCGGRPDLCKELVVDILRGEIFNVYCRKADSTCFNDLIITADRPDEIKN